jgi:hypothetical protein
MNRRRFAITAAMTAAALLIGIGGEHQAVARKRRRRRGGGSTAVASAQVTETGGRVSVAVNCVPGQSASDSDSTQATVRC